MPPLGAPAAHGNRLGPDFPAAWVVIYVRSSHHARRGWYFWTEGVRSGGSGRSFGVLAAAKAVLEPAHCYRRMEEQMSSREISASAGSTGYSRGRVALCLLGVLALLVAV